MHIAQDWDELFPNPYGLEMATTPQLNKLKGARMVTITGPVGVGKQLLVAAVTSQFQGVQWVPDIRTRPFRKGEVQGVDLLWMTPVGFQTLEKRGELITSQLRNGHCHGIGKWQIQRALAAGLPFMVEKAPGQLLALLNHPLVAAIPKVSVLLLAPSGAELIRRNIERQARLGSSEDLDSRLRFSLEEFRNLNHHPYDLVIVNDQIDRAAGMIAEVLGLSPVQQRTAQVTHG